jgi:flagella basal body P-ring formation protein FlgA
MGTLEHGVRRLSDGMLHLAPLGLVALLLVLGQAGAVRGATGEGAPASGRIRVGKAATVESGTVHLADVAVLEGSGTDFAGVELGPAPDPGGSRRLDGITVLQKLRAAGLDDATTRYEIPASIRVARAYQDVTGDEIRNAVEREAPTVLAPGEQLRNVEIGGSARIPPGQFDIRLGASAAAARGYHRRVDVDLVQDGGVVASVPARLEVVSSGPVVVLRRAVARGTVLERSDVTLEERELTGVSGNVVTSLEDAVGHETRAALSAGSPLTVTALASPLLVRRGDIVTVVVETPGMRLSASGEALEAGAAGARIRVKNRKSHQELSGEVVERGIVLVQY